MDYTGILKRYWHVLRNNHTIWGIGAIQGLVSLLTSVVVIGLYIFCMFFYYSMGNSRGIEFAFASGASLVTGGMVAIIFVFILIMLVFQFEVFMADIAVIKTVDKFDQAGEKTTFKQAVKYGWSKQVFRIFGLQVILFVVFLIELIVVSGLSLGLYKLLENLILDQGLIIMIVMGASLLLFALFSIPMLLIVPFIEMARRVCILEDKGIVESIRRTVPIYFAQPLQLILMKIIIYLVQFVQYIAVSILNMVFSFIAYILAAVVFVVIASIAAVFSSNEFIGGAIMISVVLAYLISMLPMGIMSAMMYITNVSMWTLTYRHVVGKENEQPEVEPAPLPG